MYNLALGTQTATVYEAEISAERILCLRRSHTNVYLQILIDMNGRFVIGPNHVINDFCGGGFAMTGTATMTLTSCPILDLCKVAIESELSILAQPSNYIPYLK